MIVVIQSVKLKLPNNIITHLRHSCNKLLHLRRVSLMNKYDYAIHHPCFFFMSK